MAGPNYRAQAAQHGAPSVTPGQTEDPSMRNMSVLDQTQNKYAEKEARDEEKNNGFFARGWNNLKDTLSKGVEDVKAFNERLANNNNLDGVKLQTAGYGGNDETAPTSDTSNASVAADTNNGKSDGASETVSDIIQNNPEQAQRYTNSMMGIWDAFREGKIDKGTALYFTLDSISKLARNTGKDLANIGAAFTGGTINNEREDSLWSQRRDKMFENELAGEVESQGGTPAYRAMLHDLNSLSMEDKNLFAKDIENWLANNSKGITVDMLKQQLAAMGYANIANQFDTFTQKELLDMSKSNDPATAALGKAGISAANVVNSSGGAIGKAIGSAMAK